MYQVIDIVGELDLSTFAASYDRDGRGAPALALRLMVSVLIYGWCQGVYSSRKLSTLCRDDVRGRGALQDLAGFKTAQAAGASFSPRSRSKRPFARFFNAPWRTNARRALLPLAKL